MEVENDADVADEEFVPTRREEEIRLMTRATIEEEESMCERRINGILADEMGLGKTIQTISLLATRIVLRDSGDLTLFVVRNCAKVVEAERVPSVHYKLPVGCADAHCFKRKKWYYLILDEAHNIKNWKSLRWQTLLTFSSQRRLLLTVARKVRALITCQLSKRQRFLYEDFISRSSTRRAMFGRGKGRGANFMSMMNVLMQLRKHLRANTPRCGYLVDEIVNERPRVALWTGNNLPGLELLCSEKFSSKRRRELFFYDQGGASIGSERASVAQLQKIQAGLYLDEPCLEIHFSGLARCRPSSHQQWRFTSIALELFSTTAEELEVKHAQPVANRILAPYHNSFKRTQLFFPDKALVQFDCGKLQQLAVLLRTLKRGGHRCLIFTQMSSMLNILEVFLNLHGHTYFRARAEYLQELNEFDDDAARGPHSGDTASKPSTPSSVVSGSTAASERGDDEDDAFGNEDTEDDTVVNGRGRRGSRRDLATPDGLEQESMDEDDDHKKTAKSGRKRQRRSSNVGGKTPKRPKLSESHDQHGKNGDKVREKARDAAEEQKLQAWKASVQSLQGFEDSLNPVDRYALHFREDVDPLKARRRDRLIAEGELVVGQMDDNDETSSEQIAERYTELYRRERAHVLFESRKRLLTGAAWSLMKLWLANEQLKSAQKRGYEGLPPPALRRVLSMLTPFPERHRAQMVCRSWHTAAQHQSLFVKVFASDFDPGSPASLAKVLTKVAPGDTVLFGAGVYQLDETLEISKSLRLLAAPDSHVELQMHSCRAQLRWSARGGVICGFHFTRTSSAPDAAAREIKPSSDVQEKTPVVKESRRVLRNQNKKLANWQHLLSVVGDGQLRVEYCEFDGNGLGNACVCVWGRGEKKKKEEEETWWSSNSYDWYIGSCSDISHHIAGYHTTGCCGEYNATCCAFNTEGCACCYAYFCWSSSCQASVCHSSAFNGSYEYYTEGYYTGSDYNAARDYSRDCYTAAVAVTPTIPAADTLLVLQNCRIRGAGSSGVLLVRGSLVMSLNTVEGNAHSGVTVLGGQALMRRNKIQRNARFGLRLLYHAGNVIVEDNVVLGNACGNLDVDNSGRRFVVRLNDMDKRKKTSEKLPHSHGKLRLKTYRVLEKEVPRATPIAKPVTNVTSATRSNALHVSHLPMAFASLGAKPTIPSVTLNRLTTSAQLPTPATNLQRTVSAPGAASSAPARPVTIPGTTSVTSTTSTTVATPSGMSLFVPKYQRKRRPKTQQIVVGGREIVLRDTCEKPTEKVVKPRRPKDPQTPVPASSMTQQMTSPSALQLKFAPGSTAAAVAAAMNTGSDRRFCCPGWKFWSDQTSGSYGECRWSETGSTNTSSDYDAANAAWKRSVSEYTGYCGDTSSSNCFDDDCSGFECECYTPVNSSYSTGVEDGNYFDRDLKASSVCFTNRTRKQVC
ncbi:P-loop containing nucleoside triphosphate hydrolase [Phytophthora cactorum]|nr:P-loop containing nucleoside triphosphate hydrolase [Phytophthora cactorum]